MNNSKLLLVLVSSLPALFGCSSLSLDSLKAASFTQPFLRISHATHAARDYVELGRYHQGRNSLPEAIDAYRAAIEIDSSNVDAHTALGTVYAVQGRFDKALVEFNLAIEASPKDADLHNNLGFAYFLKKDYAEATAAYEKAIALDPASVRAYNNLGASYRQAGQAEASRVAFAKAEELSAAAASNDGAKNNLIAGKGRQQKTGSAVSMPAGVNLGTQGRDTGISLIAANHDDATITLQNPEALLLKVEAALRNSTQKMVSGTEVLQWKTIVSDEAAPRESASSALRLKLSTQISARSSATLKTPAGNEVMILEPVSATGHSFNRGAIMTVKS